LEIKESRHHDISASERLDMLKQFCNYGFEHWGSDTQGVNTTRRFLLEWLSFLHKYSPVGVIEGVQKMQDRPPRFVPRSDLEALLASPAPEDWVKISCMLLCPVPENFRFEPKHKSGSTGVVVSSSSSSISGQPENETVENG
jgi:tRNA-dihydrouridine synthase 3